MNEHPDELLADLAGDAMSGADRRAVEAHMAGCARCRGELALARGARAALASLTEVPVPAGLGTPALQRARPDRRLARVLGWAAAATTVAAAATIFAVLFTGGGWQAALSPASQPEAASPAAPEAGQTARSPALLSSGRDYGEAELTALAERIASGRTATAASPEQFADSKRAAVTNSATDCLRAAGVSVTSTDGLVYVEEARFHGRQAYIAALLNEATGEVEVTAVSRAGCAILGTARASPPQGP